MIPTLARGAVLLGDAVATGGRGLVSGPFGSSNPPHRPSCDGGSRGGGSGGSGGNNGSSSAAAVASATTAASSTSSTTTTSLPNSSLYAIRTSSRFNFARPSFEVSRRPSVEASAQSTKKFVRRVSLLFSQSSNRMSSSGTGEIFLLRFFSTPWRQRSRAKVATAPRRLLCGFAGHSPCGNGDSAVSIRSSRCHESHSRLPETRCGGGVELSI